MLIRFSVENFRSFRDRMDLTLDASADTDLGEVVRFRVHGMPAATRGMLTVASIHGANASGKSNIVKAIRCLNSLVGLATRFPGGVLPEEMIGRFGLPSVYSPFRLDDDSDSKPVFFELEFLSNGKRWVYGLRFDASAILGEWLIHWPNGRAAFLFARGDVVDKESRYWLFDRDTKETEPPDRENEPGTWRWTSSDSKLHSPDPNHVKELWFWGTDFERGSREGIALATRTRVDMPFLSVASGWNHPQALQVIEWFRNLQIIDATQPYTATVGDFHLRTFERNGELRTWVENWMRAADLGISSIRIYPELEEAPDLRNRKRSTKAIHLTEKGREVEFDMDEESHGTTRLFGFAFNLYRAIQNGGVIIVDELHAGLHPLLLRALVKIFQSTRFNPKNAQLIFTTHDVCVLDNALLRRDQIHLVEKNGFGASEMFSVSDCDDKPRKNSPLMKYYLSGNLGGIPDLDIELIFGE